MCFDVLHNERGLSCHFLIDNDGTIFQTLDLALAGLARRAVEHRLDRRRAVQLRRREDASPTTTRAASAGRCATSSTCKINGHTILAFDYTPAQYDAFAKLVRALQRLLPNMPARVPAVEPRRRRAGTRCRQQASFGFAGYIGHYHLTNQKWDPGPFDFKDVLRQAARRVLPADLHQGAQGSGRRRRSCPSRAEDLKVATRRAATRRTSSAADGGFFPVGPWGEARLWHGGVHLTGKHDGAGVRAVPRPPRRGAHGRELADRLDQLRAAAPRDVARHLEGPVLLAVHAPRRRARSATSRRRVDREERDLEEGGKPGEVVLLDEPIEAGARDRAHRHRGPGRAVARRRSTSSSSRTASCSATSPARRGR